MAEGWSGRGRALLASLEAERDALLAGRFEQAARGATRIDAALDALLRAPPLGDAAERELEAIRRAARRNRRLLDAARRGIEETRCALAAARTAKDRLGYDAQGAPVTSSASRLSRA